MRNADIFPARLGGYTVAAYTQSVKQWETTARSKQDAEDMKWAWIQRGTKPT